MRGLVLKQGRIGSAASLFIRIYFKLLDYLEEWRQTLRDDVYNGRQSSIK